jgi:hypothetical protein
MQREDDAKTKWCPFAHARLYGDPDIAGNRSRQPPRSAERRETLEGATRCLGSGCAVWIAQWPRTDPPGTPYGRCGLTHPSS